MTAALWLFLLAIVDAGSGSAQTAQRLSTPEAHVVMLRVGPNGRRGAGVIVGHTGTVLHIVTARHNITGLTRAVAIAEDPQCRSDVDVSFRWTHPNSRLATNVHCSDDPNLDLAVLDVDVGDDVSQVARQEIAASSGVATTYEVLVIGHANDGGWQTAVHRITQTTGEFRDDSFMTTRVSLPATSRTVTSGSDQIAGGYSGGAVVDQRGGLLGLMLEADQGGLSIPWRVVETFLDREARSRPRDLLVPRTAPVNPSFKLNQGPGTADEEAIAVVLNRYALALASQQADAVAAVRRDVNRAELAALIGDATSLQLALNDCQKIAIRGEDAEVTCGHVLTITRHTGPRRTIDSSATFYLRRENLSWYIVGLR